MENTTYRLIEKLKQYYAGDPTAMHTLANFERSPQIINQYRVLRENPIVKKIADEAYSKMMSAHDKLVGIEALKLSQEERAFHLATIDWADWFLRSLGEDPDKATNALEERIQSLALRAGIVSKD